MKNQLCFISILIIGIIYFVGCSDDNNPTSPSPDLKYVGNWLGIAAQDSINIEIKNVDNKAQITHIYAKVTTVSGTSSSTSRREKNDTSGLAYPCR